MIDRLSERRNDAESKISDALRREMSRPVRPPQMTTPSRQRRRNPRRNEEKTTPNIDLMWKDGGKDFPKRSSNVGAQYQVSVIPKAGTYQEATNQQSDY